MNICVACVAQMRIPKGTRHRTVQSGFFSPFPLPGVKVEDVENQVLMTVECEYSLGNQRCVCVRSVVSDSLRPHGLLAYEAPLPMEFSGQEFWNGVPFPSLGNLPGPRD